MDWKLEVVVVPVTDVDRAKRFYTEQAGFIVDHDTRINDLVRFVQLTPPGSACSIVLGSGPSPGSARPQLGQVQDPASSGIVKRLPSSVSISLVCPRKSASRSAGTIPWSMLGSTITIVPHDAHRTSAVAGMDGT